MLDAHSLNESLPNLDAYLERINYHGPTTLDKEALDALVYAHQCNVPFENLAIYAGKLPVSLAMRDLYDKVVTRRQGGYCFELNALFYSLLKAMGCSPIACLARVLMMKDFIPPEAHRITLVPLDGERYFCDVGFGGAIPGGALLLKEGVVQEVHGERFFFVQKSRHVWQLNRLVEDGEASVVSFRDTPQTAMDFLPANAFCSLPEDAYFRNNRIANIRKPGGFCSYMNDSLEISQNGVKHRQTLSSDDEVRQALEEHFGLYDVL